MPAAASAGCVEPASSAKATPENRRHAQGREPSMTRCGRDAPHQSCQDTPIGPAVGTADLPHSTVHTPRTCTTKGAGKRSQHVSMSPDGGTGFTDFGKEI